MYSLITHFFEEKSQKYENANCKPSTKDHWIQGINQEKTWWCFDGALCSNSSYAWFYLKPSHKDVSYLTETNRNKVVSFHILDFSK